MDASELVHLLELLEESTHTPVIVVVGDRTGETKVWAKKVSLKLVTWEDLESASPSSLQVPVPSKVYNISMTAPYISKLLQMSLVHISLPSNMG